VPKRDLTQNQFKLLYLSLFIYKNNYRFFYSINTNYATLISTVCKPIFSSRRTQPILVVKNYLKKENLEQLIMNILLQLEA